MRTFALWMITLLALGALPYAIADHGDEGHDDAESEDGSGPAPLGAVVDADSPDETIAELERRIAELEAMVAALAGGDEGEAQEPCTSGFGCVRGPIYVDEIGDRMTGDLEMDDARVKFFPENALDTDGGVIPETTLGADVFYINTTNTNFTQVVNLLADSILQANPGSEIFLDYDSNLSFADGSFLNAEEGLANQNWTFTSSVTIEDNLTIQEGGNIIFEDNTGILQNGNFSRIGTTSPNEFVIITNNTTAMVFIAGPTEEDSANIIGGHEANNVTANVTGNFIAGGGTALDPNLADGDFNTILGGTGNTATGDHNTVGGQHTDAVGNNSFVWNDGAGGFTSTSSNTFIVNASNGVGIGTDTPVSEFTVDGDITPATSGVETLGTTTHRWHQVFLSSVIDFVDELEYTSNGQTVMVLDDQGNLTLQGRLVGDASGLTGITTDAIANESIDASKIADGAVTTSKIASGAVSFDKLASGCTEGQLLKWDGAAWGCAEDVNSDTMYSAGSGLNLVGTEFSVDTSTIQSRIANACPEGQYLFAVAQDGTVSCALDQFEANSDVLAALACTADQIARYDDLAEAWVCGEDADTTYGAGFGLGLTGTTFDADSTVLQRRITDPCAAGSSIRAVAQDGTVLCETDDDTLYTAGVGLTLEGTVFSLVGNGVTSTHVQDGTLTSSDVDSSSIQLRVSGSCATSEAIRVINADGTVVCQAASTDATTLDGLDSTQFIRSDITDTFDGQDYTFSDEGGFVAVAGDLNVGTVNATDDDYIYFDDGTEYIRWQDIRSQFHMTAPLHTTDRILVNPTWLAGDYNRIGNKGAVATMDSAKDLLVSEDLQVGGVITAQDNLDVTGNVTAAWFSGDGSGLTGVTSDDLDGLDSTQFLRSDVSDTFTGTAFTIDTTADFILNGQLGSNIIPTTNDTYMLGNNTHRFSDLWLASTIHHSTPLNFESGGMDVFVVDTDGDLVSEGNLTIKGDRDSSAVTFLPAGVDSNPETLSFDKNAWQFVFSDDSKVSGALEIDAIVGDEQIIFDNPANYLRWDRSDNKFDFTSDLSVGLFDANDDDLILFDGQSTQESFGWLNDAAQFMASDDLEVRGGLSTDSHVTLDRGSLPIRIYFNDAQDKWFAYVPANEQFDINDDLKVNFGSLAVNDGIDHQWGANISYHPSEINTAEGYGGVKATGFNDNIAGFLGVNGANDFEDFASADWSAYQVGVAGISNNNGSKNFGVLGHGDSAGVRGESSADPSTAYAELGTSDLVGIRASGSAIAGDFLGDVDVSGDMAANTVTVEGTRILMGAGQGDANRQIYFHEDGNDLGEQFSWSNTFDYFELTDELRLTQGGTLGVNVAPSAASMVNAVQTTATSGYHGVRGEGVFGPTVGYLGAQGATDFDGILSLDYIGHEIGVLGASVGGSNNDNFGVLGHSNDVGVRGEWSGNPTATYAELGTRFGYGIEADGTAGAALLRNDLIMTAGSDVVFNGNNLGETAGTLQYNGNDVCLDTGNCASGSSIKVPAVNDVRLGQVSSPINGAPGQTVSSRGYDSVPTLDAVSAGGVSVCFTDDDGDGLMDLAEPSYLNMDADTCGAESVEVGDLRLVAAGGQAAFTTVRISDTDFGNPLTAGTEPGLADNGAEMAWYDVDGNARFTPGDAMYVDANDNGLADVGDVRIVGGDTFEASGEKVNAGSSDLNVGLNASFTLDTATSYWDTNASGAYDRTDIPYFDISEG